MASAGLAFSGIASKATAAVNQTAQSYNRIVGASNKVNIAYATIEALRGLVPKDQWLNAEKPAKKAAKPAAVKANEADKEAK